MSSGSVARRKSPSLTPAVSAQRRVATGLPRAADSRRILEVRTLLTKYSNYKLS